MFDKEFLDIVDDILKNKEFLKLKGCEHHGITRFEHSLKVSYKAYKLAKKLNLDYIAVARGGLLHDFFLEENFSMKEKLVSSIIHPLKAEQNAIRVFKVNNLERDIIKSHMFPTTFIIPKYKESWLVSYCDKIVGSKEFISKFGFQLRYAINLILLILINFAK